MTGSLVKDAVITIICYPFVYMMYLALTDSHGSERPEIRSKGSDQTATREKDEL